MLSLVGVSILMMMMMINAETTNIISVQSGDAIVLHSNLTEADLQFIKDVRWTHLYLVVSLKSNATVCPHGRCELLTDGSLRFNCVYAEDAGNYRLQTFDVHGNRMMIKDFLLHVDTVASSSVQVHVLTWVFLILLLFLSLIIFVIIRRRHQSMSPGTLMDNIYVTMHSHEDKKRREEESVSHSAAGFMETPITQQEEDIYV